MLDIKRIRKERGYSQEQLADLLGISQPALSYYEKGINEPSIDMLVKMSHVLDCSIDEICCNNIKTIELDKNKKDKIKDAIEVLKEIV